MKNIHMGLNENSNNILSKKLLCFLKKNLNQAVCYYPDPNASSLKELLAKKFNLAPQNFFISNGSDEILFILGSIMTDVKYVICPQNTFNSYKYLANLYKKTLIETPLLNYVVDIEKLIKKIRPNSMLIIPNPHNPCGTYIGKEKLEELIKSCKNKKAYLVVDEAYGEFAEAEKDDYLSALSLSNYSRMIVMRTFSKFYGLAGLRCGYAIAVPDFIQQMNFSKKILVYSVNTVALMAAQFVLKHETVSKNKKMFEYIFKLKQRLYKFCENHQLHYVPSCTNFILVNVGNADSVYHQLLKRGITTKSCSVFGFPEFLRVTLSSMKDLIKFEKELLSILKKDHFFDKTTVTSDRL